MTDATENIDDLLLNDPELVANFIAEAKEHLDTIEDDFLNLEKQRDRPDPELLNKVFRAIHSVKGAAGFLNLDNMARLAHVMETLLADMRAGKILPESRYVDALLAGVDLLTMILDDVAHHQEVDIAGAHDRLSELLEEGAAAPERPAPRPPAAAPGKAPEGRLPERGAAERVDTVRIPVDILDRLMVQAGELVLIRNQHLLTVDESDPVSRSLAHRLDLVTAELQETIIRTRMQPIGKVIGKFPRVVRELGKILGKQIRIDISGSEAELDKTILESLTDPLTHIIRNCCGHGIEPPGERVGAGKPESGLITLKAFHEAGRFSIEIRDDGRGIDPGLIRKKAVQRGIKTEGEAAQASDKELLHLIFLPGFSTADEASQVSGRGVGMDVVKTGIEKLGGSIELDSKPGEGTTVLLRLPLTLAILPALIVTQNGSLFAIPQTSLVELVCLYDEDVQTKIECADGLEICRLRGRLLPLVRLSEVLARPARFTRETGVEIAEKYHRPPASIRPEAADPAGPHKSADTGTSLNFVVLRGVNGRYGLIVDGILGTEEIVVKPMHRALKSLAIYAGATIMGNGKVALILDVEGIARHAETMLDLAATTTDIEPGPDKRELQRVLLFRSGPKEQYALPVAQIRRIEKVALSAVERIGEREYITIDEKSIRVLRLDHALKVTPLSDHESMHLILPRDVSRPVGILISDLVDIEEAALDLDTESYPEDGLLGTAIIRNTMTLFIDIDRLVKIIEPEWSAEVSDRSG
ncbi:MAG: chemotaxis protein CheA [Thermodesulfobacteriota bacterium]